jgi:hypothetical protein
MTERSSPINIPIKHSKSKFSFNLPPSDCQSYFFNLEINFFNGKKKTFKKIVDRKYAQLIDENDKINYGEIKNFKATIIKIPTHDTKELILNGDINHNVTNFTKNAEDIYIEFSKNSLNLTLCTCYYIGIDFSQTFISPPN